MILVMYVNLQKDELIVMSFSCIYKYYNFELNFCVYCFVVEQNDTKHLEPN